MCNSYSQVHQTVTCVTVSGQVQQTVTCVTVSSQVHQTTPFVICPSVFSPAVCTAPRHSVTSATVGATIAVTILCSLRPGIDSF